MKILIRLIQFLVGVTFILSGLVKANDPLGLAYKMEEFFEIWNSGLRAGNFFAKDLLINFFEFFHQQSLLLSIVMITLEIITGLALLLAWRRRLILITLILLMGFFCFLTAYAYLSVNPDGSPKFTNCGCFGDCLLISPLTSFIKDIVLFVLICILWFGKDLLFVPFGKRLRTVIMSAVLLITLALQWYVLNYLPIVDCLPMKVGNKIREQMKPPPGSRPDSVAMVFIYEKGGKQFEFTPQNLPADFETYTFVKREDKLIRKGNADPALKSFSFTGAGNMDSTTGTVVKSDSTAYVLDLPEAVVGFALRRTLQGSDWADKLQQWMKAGKPAGLPIFFASDDPAYFRNLFREKNIDCQVFACDFTNVRIAARVNPTFYYLKKGTIINKQGLKRINKLL